jgi:starch synthase (maltosyl-transferring)
MPTQSRVLIENISPIVDGGKYYAKRVINDLLQVEVDLVADGHDLLNGCLKIRQADKRTWQEVPLSFLINDRWSATFELLEIGLYEYTIEAWIDYPLSWQYGLRKKMDNQIEVDVELSDFLPLAKKIKQASKSDLAIIKQLTQNIEQGALAEAAELACSKDFEALLRRNPVKEFSTTYPDILSLRTESALAEFSSWYEFFPRSASLDPNKSGSLKDAAAQLSRVADLGFNVLYFPPIHPVGEVNRKGKNNSTTAEAGEPGSPWAIGNKHGGHKSINPELGTIKDFEQLLKKAKKLNIEIAMDFALQCAPDHPYVKEHPEWFKWRSDGTVQYAENPPKKYQDILPIYFETKDHKALWQELLSIALFWAEKGVSIFRVDNPHTKPLEFWHWLIAEVHKKYPEFIFLSEAFTRPKVMHALAKVGFTQSYSYYTWRNTKHELITYMNELTEQPGSDYFRPNFWPNTPDINPFGLQDGSEHSFLTSYFLAATLSSNYGIYGPVFEQMVHDSIPGKEEYLNSEKFETHFWDWNHSNKLTSLIKIVNEIRQNNSAFQQTKGISFCDIDNDQLIAYHKRSKDELNQVICVVNLDPHHQQKGMMRLPIEQLPEQYDGTIVVEDLISNNTYHWYDEWNFIELVPGLPFHLFKLHFNNL